MRKNKISNKQKNAKLKSNFTSYPQNSAFPLFFCLNRRYINELQKEANIDVVISLIKYRKLFWEKFQQDLLDYLCIDKFLTEGWYCFDMDKFEEFAKSVGFKADKISLQQWVQKKYGKKAKDMIEDMLFTALALAEKTCPEEINEKT